MSEVRVKVITKSSHLFGDSPSPSKNKAFPNQVPKWGRCKFLFGNECNYDWLVVYDDFRGKIQLNCPSQNTILVTTEPSSIKTYETSYTKQFGYVLSGQEDWALKHPGKIHSQPALFWYYGTTRSYDQIAQKPPNEKTLSISTVTSSKHQSHTLHKKRNFFIEELQKKLPQLDRFGRGICEINDKADALDPYRYHIAIENHRCDHWWTEKLADAFLGLTLPFYFGAPNASDYFPSESFIKIDIDNPSRSAEIIRTAMQNNEYVKRLPFIHQSRELVLEKFNFYATIAGIIEKKDPIINHDSKQTHHKLLSRKKLRLMPNNAVKMFVEKIKNNLIFKTK